MTPFKNSMNIIKKNFFIFKFILQWMFTSLYFMFVIFWKNFTLSNVCYAFLIAFCFLITIRFLKYVLIRYNINFIKVEGIYYFLWKFDQRIIEISNFIKLYTKNYLNTYIFITKIKNLLSKIKPNFSTLRTFSPENFNNIFKNFLLWYNNKKNIWMFIRIYIYISLFLFYLALILTVLVLNYENSLLDSVTNFLVWTYRFWTFPIKKIRFLFAYTYMIPINIFFFFVRFFGRTGSAIVDTYEIILENWINN
jgi:hypothetical protein